MPEFDPFQVSYDAQGIPIDTGWVPDEIVGFGACSTAEYPKYGAEEFE